MFSKNFNETLKIVQKPGLRDSQHLECLITILVQYQSQFFQFFCVVCGFFFFFFYQRGYPVQFLPLFKASALWLNWPLDRFSGNT